MKVVVTGGAGFIGSNLVRTLLGHPQVDGVRVVDNFSIGLRSNIADLEVDLFDGDVQDAGLLDRAFHGFDSVVHLAALPSVPRSIRNPLASHHANATGTLEVLEAARRAGGLHVIAASSSSVYGANPELPRTEDLTPLPMSPYAVTKLATEAYLVAYHHSFELPVLPFRFFNIYGPRQRADHEYAAVIPKWIDAALAGTPITVFGDGSQTRDFTYIDTVSQVLAEAVARGVTSAQPVNLAFGSRVSLLEVLSEIEAATSLKLPRMHTEPRAGDVAHSQADSSRLEELFPAVRPVPADAGIAATVAWYRTGSLPQGRSSRIAPG